MIIFFIFWLFIKSRTTCYINFTTNNWFYTFFFASFIKVDCSIHNSMIGYCNRIHS